MGVGSGKCCKRHLGMANGSCFNVPRAAGRIIALAAALLVTLLSVRAQDTVRYVTSIDELRRATIEGTRVIVITSHLDLASAQTASGPGELLNLSHSTEAILVCPESFLHWCCFVFQHLDFEW